MPKTTDRIVHRPGSDGLFGETAYCGATLQESLLVQDGFLMHEFDYNCTDCKRLSGEHM